MKRVCIYIVFLILPLSAKSQFVNYGTDPFNLRWKIMQTDHYKLIYPETNDSMAYRYISFLENIYPHIGKTIGGSGIKSFPVILHPENMLSNGMVSWAPRRMELIPTPSPEQLTQSWDKHLVLHESRHVLQMQKLSQGIFKPLYYILGEQTAGIAAFALPKWFLEGDAVGIETALSNGGRGRLPEFNMVYRTQMLSDNFYSYDKWAFGSYKDYTGSFYTLGYDLVSFARYKYGKDVWDKVLSRYTSHTYCIPPFSNALKNYTGINTNQLFEETFSFLNNEWIKQDSNYIQSNFKHNVNYISPPVKHYTSYNYPQVLGDSTIIAVKTSLADINSLVIIEKGKEKRLCYLGNINSRITVNHQRAYWTEYVPSIRWSHRNYSVLKYYDLMSKEIVTVTPRQRFLTPSLNESGDILAVSQPSVEGKNQITLVDIENKKEIKNYPVPSNGFVKEITWVDNTTIAAVVVNDEGVSIFHLNILSALWNELIKPTSANITSLTGHNGKLYFESGLNGINSIYELDLSTSQIYTLTSSRFGTFSPTLSRDGKQLLFSEYSPKGYRIASTSMDSLQKQFTDFNKPYKFTLAEAITKQEQFNIDTDSSQSVNYQIKAYKKGRHLFHIHSWAPFYYDAVNAISTQSDDLTTAIKPGVMVLSQDALNTTITQLGWYLKDGYNHGKLAFTYMGWYPVIDLNIDYGGKSFDIGWKKNENNKDSLYYTITNRNQVNAQAYLYIPFNFTHNHYITGFQPSIKYSYTNNRYQQLNNQKFYQYQYMLTELRYYHYRKLAQQDILPRFGFQVRLQYLNIPFDTKNFGSLAAARITSYFPGLIRGHGLMLRMGYQYQNIDGKTLYVPQQLINQARGYNYIYQTRQQLELKADYSFNIYCPDLSIGGLAYIKRIRSNVFYDLSKNQINKQSGWTIQNSYGADLIFDCNLFRLNYPLSLGIRVIKPINYGNTQMESLFSMKF